MNPQKAAKALKAIKHFEEGRPQEALVVFDELLDEYPSDLRLADLRYRTRKVLMSDELMFSNQWFAAYQSHWVDALESIGWDRQLPHHVIEIGAFEGQSTCWLSEVLIGTDHSSITVIDPFLGSVEHDLSQTHNLYEKFKANTSKLGRSSRISALRSYSSDALPELICQKIQADFIYIDGSHIARDVLADAVLCWPLLKAGGIMIFDDYEWPTCTEDLLMHPKTGIDAFMSCYASQFKRIPWGTTYQLLLQKL